MWSVLVREMLAGQGRLETDALFGLGAPVQAMFGHKVQFYIVLLKSS